MADHHIDIIQLDFQLDFLLFLDFLSDQEAHILDRIDFTFERVSNHVFDFLEKFIASLNHLQNSIQGLLLQFVHPVIEDIFLRLNGFFHLYLQWGLDYFFHFMIFGAFLSRLFIILFTSFFGFMLFRLLVETSHSLQEDILHHLFQIVFWEFSRLHCIRLEALWFLVFCQSIGFQHMEEVLNSDLGVERTVNFATHNLLHLMKVIVNRIFQDSQFFDQFGLLL